MSEKSDLAFEKQPRHSAQKITTKKNSNSNSNSTCSKEGMGSTVSSSSSVLKMLGRRQGSAIDSLERGVPVRVMRRLLLGNMELALLPEVLNREYGVTHVLNLCSSFKEPWRGSGVVGYRQVEMSDEGETDVEAFVGRMKEFVLEGMKKGKVFVHCRLGQNRSVTFVLAWLMVQEKMKLRDAHRLLSRKHSSIKIHPNYLLQLYNLEEKTFGVRTWTDLSSRNSASTHGSIEVDQDTIEQQQQQQQQEQPHIQLSKTRLVLLEISSFSRNHLDERDPITSPLLVPSLELEQL